VSQQTDRLQQQIVEVQRVGLTETAFVLVIDRSQARGLGVGGGLDEVGGRLLVVLRETDSGQRGPVLHELLVQPQPLVDGFDHRQLVVFGVDGEQRIEAGSKIGQGCAIPPQQPHRKGVERRQPRPRNGVGRAQQAQHPVAHLVGGFVCEGDRQNGVGGNALDADQTGDAVGDYAGLPAPRPRQDQDRAIEQGNRFTLLGIEAFQEVHRKGRSPILPRAVHSPICKHLHPHNT
jgi:hypothetical protein